MRALLLACWLSWHALVAWSHGTPQSLVVFQVDESVVTAQVKVPLDRLQLAGALPKGSAIAWLTPAMQVALSRYALSHFKVTTVDGLPWHLEVSNMSLVLVPDDQPQWLVHLSMSPPVGATSRQWRLTDDMVTHEVVTHRILVALGSDWRSGKLGGEPRWLGTIGHGADTLLVSLATGGPSEGWLAAVNLGAQHIAEGMDHLLFLLMLLLPAPWLAVAGQWQPTASWRQAARQVLITVSCFTLGHSLSLAVGALSEVSWPQRPIEILVALSILVSAAHAWRPMVAGRVPLIATGFGMIHGLAFAGTLLELQLHGASKAMALLGFNLGIELMQLVVVALALPLIWWLARTRHQQLIRQALALGASLMAAFWLIQRV